MTHGAAVCLRSDALPETWTPAVLPSDGPPLEDGTVGRFMTDGAVLGRLPTLAEIGETAVFLASDRASAITRTVVDMTSGSVLD